MRPHASPLNALTWSIKDDVEAVLERRVRELVDDDGGHLVHQIIRLARVQNAREAAHVADARHLTDLPLSLVPGSGGQGQ